MTDKTTATFFALEKETGYTNRETEFGLQYGRHRKLKSLVIHYQGSKYFVFLRTWREELPLSGIVRKLSKPL